VGGYEGDGYNCTVSVSSHILDVSEVTKVVVSFSVALLFLITVSISALFFRSRKKELWLYHYKTDWGKQEIDKNFKPVDPEPSLLTSASLISIIEPLNNQRTGDSLDQETCSLIQQRNCSFKADQGCTAKHCSFHVSELPLDELECRITKDESGFISDTSSSKYLSFYELSHQA
jgi:hypothetical protein